MGFKMRLSKITVSGFRSFSEEVSIEDFNRVNIFVGKNNTGKTNTLEILRFMNVLSNNNLYRSFSEILSKSKETISIRLIFILEDMERNELIDSLFRDNHNINVKDVIKSNFLKIISHEIKAMKTGLFYENVEISNITSDNEIIWKYGDINMKNYNIMTRNIFEKCKQIEKIENLSLSIEKIGDRNPAWQLFTNPLRDIDVIPNKIKSFYQKIEWIPPIRQSQALLPVQEVKSVDATCSNIPQVWHTIASDDPRELVKILDQIKKILPDVNTIRAPLRGQNTEAELRESSGLAFNLQNTSAGYHQIALIVTKIMTCGQSSLILCEEPEIHLHASALRGLRNFIDEYSNKIQFFITTHSTLIAKMNTNSSLYLITKKDVQSYVKHISESGELKLIKLELGHNNVDFYGFNVVVFIEGDSEEIAFPIIIERLGYDFIAEGIKLLNVKGNGKAIKIEQYLMYLKDSDTIPFIIMDGNKDVKKHVEDWIRTGILSEGNYVMWDLEFEDLFDLKLIEECCIELGYKGITADKLGHRAKIDLSIVREIERILYENEEPKLDKTALSETIANKISKNINYLPHNLKETIEKIITLSLKT